MVALLGPPHDQWEVSVRETDAERDISDLFISGRVSGCPGHVTERTLRCRQVLTLGFTQTQKGTCGAGISQRPQEVQCLLPREGPAQRPQTRAGTLGRPGLQRRGECSMPRK